MEALLVLGFYVASGAITGSLAKKRGRSSVGWFLAGFFLPLISLALLFLLPKKVSYAGPVHQPYRQARVHARDELPSHVPATDHEPANPECIIYDGGRMMARVDFMVRVLDALGRDRRLQRIFGHPVADSLLLVAENGDIRIVEDGETDISRHDQEYFLTKLDETIQACA